MPWRWEMRWHPDCWLDHSPFTRDRSASSRSRRCQAASFSLRHAVPPGVSRDLDLDAPAGSLRRPPLSAGARGHHRARPDRSEGGAVRGKRLLDLALMLPLVPFFGLAVGVLALLVLIIDGRPLFFTQPR